MCNVMPTNMVRSVLVMCLLLVGLCAIIVHTHPTSNKNVGGGGVKAPDPESLPPDTFRKLAQALYQRGDKAENRLHRKFFYNGNITCNDGSVAGYYIRRNYNSKRWIIFLEGGWICHDDISCSERRAREPHRMSSDRWPSVKTAGGILSADPAENPHFADANHVFVPYCSSDAWSGYALGRPASPEAAVKTGDLAFMGGHIVREVIRELADFQQLLFGRELYLAGSSAGGIGVMMNVDSVAGMVARAGLKVRGIVDSGWFLDNDPFSAMECSAGKGKCSVIASLQQGVRLWKARVPSTCHQNFPGEIWKCFLGYRLFPFIKTPLFIFQWQFDKFQLYADNVAIPASRDQWNYIHQMGNNLRATFNNLSAVFSPACIAHEVITKPDWTTVNVEGVTLPDALQCWAQSLPDAVSLDLSAELSIRDQLGHSGNDVIPVGNNRPRSVSMLADEPLTSFKTGSNLVRAIDVSTDMDSTRNSIASRLQKNLDADGNRTDRQLELSTNTRSGATSGRDNRRRRKRRRLRHLKQRCRQGDDEACTKLRRLVQAAAAITNSNNDPDMSDDESDDEMFNGDLVRSLDRRSSKRRTRRKHGIKKMKGESEEEHRQRKMLRQQEKEERRRKRKEQKEKKRQLKRQRRKEMREKRKLADLQQQQQQDHVVSKRSVDSATCQVKLIDSCTWPHCNPSCPKLKNPETGQDIDFLTLLQSFGLDMTSVAQALGVDITTLNNMDREVLIHLLTSQGNAD